jgi:ABC-type transport system substrate-binding protein
VKLLHQALDFGFAPIGAGPYRLKNISQTDLSTEVTLERFERPVPPVYRLDRLVFRIFSDYRSMLSDVRNLDGIRLIAHTNAGKPIAPDKFTTVDYTLPQYVALYFNLDRGALRDQKLRLGLQLGTNKQEIVDTISLAKIVDTPFLELKQEAWEYAFDPKAAQGALFESSWYYPEKIRLQKLLEQREANIAGLIKVEPIVLLDTGAALTVSGVGGGLSGKDRINGIPLRSNPTESGGWIVALPTHGGTGALRIGMNLIRLTNDKGAVLDSAYVLRTADGAEFQRAAAEQRLIESFLSTRSGERTGAMAVGSSDMVLQDGYLRGRTPDDVVSIRINDRGDQLNLRLLTSPQPENYPVVAKVVADQWRKLGVNVAVDVPATRAEFEEKLLKRDYDVLLFGQSLLDNLDSYPYWHSSGVQKITGKRADLRLDAYNLSQYASFESDTLLEQIRGNASVAQRQSFLQKLQEQFRRDVPAVFLYSPVYTFAHREDIQGITVGRLSLHSDRFRTLYSWYIKQDRVFKPGTSWFSFFGWMFGLGRNAPVSAVSGTGTILSGSGAVE